MSHGPSKVSILDEGCSPSAAQRTTQELNRKVTSSTFLTGLWSKSVPEMLCRQGKAYSYKVKMKKVNTAMFREALYR